MHRTKQLAIYSACLIMVVLSIGCASTVHIDSEPSGAEVTINGQYIGETPTSYTDTAIVFTRHQVVLEKEGYERTTAQLTRDGQINAAAVVVGFFFAWPLWLWAMDYPTNVTYKLREPRRANPPGTDGETNSVTFILQPADETARSELTIPSAARNFDAPDCYVCQVAD